MKTSDRGILLIRCFEGYQSGLYDDCAGHCTVGYGHLVHLGRCDGRSEEGPFKQGVTRDEAVAMLRDDVAKKAEPPVNVGVEVEINQNQYDALVSFTYNLGAGAFLGSTLLKKLNAGDVAGAAAEFARWDKAGGKVVEGLVRRRAEEAKLFLEPRPEMIVCDPEISV